MIKFKKYGTENIEQRNLETQGNCDTDKNRTFAKQA